MSEDSAELYFTRVTITSDESLAEILIAELGEIGFDSFLETESGFEAYIEQEKFVMEDLQSLLARYNLDPSAFGIGKVKKENWNELWERSYNPIEVEGRCRIRAAFHEPDPAFQYEIIITPKMSFGTGHHQTTYLMIQAQMEIDHQGKMVMDAGCGTAILSIMAAKLGAKRVDAFDIDDWSVTNAQENIAVNEQPNIDIRKGKICELTFNSTFDIILANINKNILLEEMKRYKEHLNEGGLLLLSGFYKNDIPDMIAEASSLGFKEVTRYSKDDWASLLLRLIPN